MARWIIVAPIWLFMSSPAIGMPFSSNFPAHVGSDAINSGMQFMKATLASRHACA